METSLLAGVPLPERERLLGVARRRTFSRQEVVFHRYDPADSLHFIVKGRFGVRVTTPYGDTLMLAVSGPGETFGELALISPTAPRSATVIALEAGETRALHRIDFDRLRAEHPIVTEMLVGALAERVRRLSDLLVDALYTTAETRVLRRLAELAGADGAAELPLTQEQLAEVAGTSRATVNRVLREAAERCEVKVLRGRVTVIDPDALDRRARRR